ncbi:MAG: hypothetical protein HRU15_11960 [Planctomycetes bacterium]|nr:hypothetical protein [Planctomycetota bacterium]
MNGSPSLVDGKIYIIGNRGTTLIIKPGREYKEIARNRINTFIFHPWQHVNEGWGSSPFFDGGQIYYRAQRYLYCIGGAP